MFTRATVFRVLDPSSRPKFQQVFLEAVDKALSDKGRRVPDNGDPNAGLDTKKRIIRCYSTYVVSKAELDYVRLA